MRAHFRVSFLLQVADECITTEVAITDKEGNLRRYGEDITSKGCSGTKALFFRSMPPR